MGSLFIGWKLFCWFWYCFGLYLCFVGFFVFGGLVVVVVVWGLFFVWLDVMLLLLYLDEIFGVFFGWWGVLFLWWGGGGDVYFLFKDLFEFIVFILVLLFLWKELLFVCGEKLNFVCLFWGFWVVFVGVGIFVWCLGEFEWLIWFLFFIGDIFFIEDDDSVLYFSLSFGFLIEEDILFILLKVEEDDGELWLVVNGWRK